MTMEEQISQKGGMSANTKANVDVMDSKKDRGSKDGNSSFRNNKNKVKETN